MYLKFPFFSNIVAWCCCCFFRKVFHVESHLRPIFGVGSVGTDRSTPSFLRCWRGYDRCNLGICDRFLHIFCGWLLPLRYLLFYSQSNSYTFWDSWVWLLSFQTVYRFFWKMLAAWAIWLRICYGDGSHCCSDIGNAYPVFREFFCRWRYFPARFWKGSRRWLDCFNFRSLQSRACSTPKDLTIYF